MTTQHKIGLDVLAFWRAIEYLTPASPDDATMTARDDIATPEDCEGSWDVKEARDLPWHDRLKFGYAPKMNAKDPAKVAEKWRFVITIGFSKVDGAMAELRDLLGHLPDDEERPGGGRDMAVASIVVSDSGQLCLSESGRPSVSVAPLPWAMGILAAGKAPTAIEGFEGPDGFESNTIGRIIGDLEEACAPEEGATTRRSLTLDHLEGVRDAVTAAAGWTPRNSFDLLARISAVKVTARKDGTFGDTDPALLGSFIAADLTTVRSALAGDDAGTALLRYLYGRKLGESITDLVRDPAAAASLLAPAQLPAARWPSKRGQRLALAQQLAVNTAFDQLKGQSGLFSVNGPPGTGKTTLLRDLVAAIIVERAETLASFATPADAFVEKVTPDGHPFPIWRLDPRLRGFEMVVASTNNGAVENVTTELPGLKAIHEDWRTEPGHFREAARTLLEDAPDPKKRTRPESKESWALLAAVLGNKTNRRRFVDRFWFLDYVRDKLPHWVSFKDQLTRLSDAPPSWRDACRVFAERRAEVERLRQRPVAVLAAQERVAILEARLAEWDGLERDVGNHDALRPSWLDLLRPWRWIVWLRRGGMLKDRFDAMTRQLIADGGRANGHRLRDATSRLDMVRQMAATARRTFETLREDFQGTIPDAAFFARQPPDEREKSAPWIEEAFEDARKRCFLAALDLHRAFLANAASQMKANLQQMCYVLNGKTAPHTFGDALGDLWASLFLAVPVVSTTFASFPRLFVGMDRESLGWLLVDEAGQATPQAAAGAVWRAKRAVVIGDPLQIEPVVPMPSKAIEALRIRFGIADLWHPTKHSAQVLADRANPIGGHIGKTWVGSPLRVHRRCVDPMFSVANRIAYDGVMVFGDVADQDMPLGKSRWLDVAGMPADDGHFIAGQGQAAATLIAQAHAAGRLKDLYVISPFRSVAEGMRKMARAAKLPSDWIKTGIGTVHTFQGKEADMVILLLGGNPGRPGAFRWAAERPNLLNVALTRAKRRVYVIGDEALWAREDYFSTLSAALKDW